MKKEKKRPVYLYLDRSNKVVYCCFEDSIINSNNTNLKRYIIDSNNIGLFIRYNQLQLHNLAVKNIV